MRTDIELRRERRVVLSIVAGAFALANLLVPSAFEHTSPSNLVAGIAYFCAGGLVAEVCVLAIWGAMAASPLKYRIPISSGLVLVAACTFLVGVRLLDDSMPLGVAVVIIGLSFGMYVCLLFPLAIVRHVTRKRIAVPSEVRASAQDRPETQFGLRYLLAVVVLVGPWIALTVLEMGYGPNGQDWWEAMLVTSTFGAGVSATTLLLLFVWRQLGYRLVGPRSGYPFANKGCGEQVDPDDACRDENS